MSKEKCVDHLLFLGGKSLGEDLFRSLQPLFATALAIAFLELALLLPTAGGSDKTDTAGRHKMDLAEQWLVKENNRLGSLAFRFGLPDGWVKFAEGFLREHSSHTSMPPNA